MISFEYPHFLANDQPFIPRIFDAGPGEMAPEGFNAVRVSLDGTHTSDLKWDHALAVADHAIVSGHYVLWDLDLGLFSRLTQPLSDMAQFHTLQLAVAHLLQLIRERYAPKTLGVVLYRGNLDMTRNLLKCDDIGPNDCSTYLNQLTLSWPEAIVPILIFNTTAVTNPLLRLQLSHRERFNRFAMISNASHPFWPALGWGTPSPYGFLGRKIIAPATMPKASRGILIPLEGRHEALNKLLPDSDVRPVTAEFLTAEWDGLETLIVPSNLPPLIERKLQGFRAAGGDVVEMKVESDSKPLSSQRTQGSESDFRFLTTGITEKDDVGRIQIES